METQKQKRVPIPSDAVKKLILVIYNNMNIGLIILIIVACIIAVNYNQYEPFDATNSVFEPLGQPRYGLRGEKLDTRAINDCYYALIDFRYQYRLHPV